MPQITKVNSKPTSKRTKGTIEDRIQPITELEGDGIMLVVYGRSKTGKTRFACTFPKPLLIIGTEKGTKSIKGIKGVDFFRLQHTQEIEALLPVITNKYKSVVVDTAGGLQDIALREVLGLDDIPVQKSWGMAKREEWSACGIQTKERLQTLLRLSESNGTHVVIIAHERNFKEEGDSEIIFPTVGAALTPSVAGWLNGAVDYICQTYIREEVVRTPLVEGEDTMLESKTGKKEYCLRVGPHPVFLTGFRLPPGIELPDSVVNPDYNKIMKLINGQAVK